MTIPSFSLPVTILVGLATMAGGWGLAVEKADTQLTVRQDNQARQIELLMATQHEFARTSELVPQISDLKRQLDSIQVDVRELRRYAAAK